ncbi:ABC transporter ATP-binding protein [Pseudohongiella acticola]|jgi:ABC-type multidrug transport system ATPase subunit|uniref:ABC transporter ATP-binding protein n=1 Tax=Pseudohongiella acticola TaxID=1524254 RepID=UPI0030EDDF0A
MTGAGTIEQVLSIAALEKRYGNTRVLAQLDLTVQRGAIHGLVGLNGSGKTTTLECVLGMQTFQAGELTVLGRAPSRLWQGRGDVVGIFDAPSLHPTLTVRQVLEHARLICGQPVRSPAEVETLLGISRYSNYKIKQLSLGNRRRASIAQALIGQPEFIVLDEPFNGLDAGGVDDVLALIRQLNLQHGTTFLLSSHQLAYLENICTDFAILHQGRIALNGSVDTLFRDQHTQLNVRCDQSAKACALLTSMSGISSVTSAGPDEDALLTLTLDNIDAATINSALVHAGIAVAGLELQKPSLAQLFHNIVETH